MTTEVYFVVRGTLSDGERCQDLWLDDKLGWSNLVGGVALAQRWERKPDLARLYADWKGRWPSLVPGSLRAFQVTVETRTTVEECR